MTCESCLQASSECICGSTRPPLEMAVHPPGEDDDERETRDGTETERSER